MKEPLKKKLKTGTLIFAGCVLAGLVFTGYANWQIYRCGRFVYENTDDVPEREYGLLLGTVKMLGQWHNMFYVYRIQAAAELYKAGKVRKIIVSGDNSRKGYDETSDMKNDLVALGIPEENVLCDYAGFRTLDSVVRTENVFGVKQYTVISQRFHCERAVYIAQAHGHDTAGFAAKDPVRTVYRIYFREIFARVLAWLDTEILNRKPHFEK